MLISKLTESIANALENACGLDVTPNAIEAIEEGLAAMHTEKDLQLASNASKKTTGNLPGGCIVAVVEVVGCRPATPEDSAAAYFKVEREGQYWAVELSHPLRLPVPVPVKGRLGLFETELEGR